MFLGLFSLLLGQLAGSTIVPIFTKIGLSFSTPLVFVCLRFVIASILFAPFFFFGEKSMLSKRDYRNFFILAGLLFGNVTLFSIAVQYTTVLMTQILYTTTPVI